MATFRLNGLNGHFKIFTLQIFCFCRHMWRCGDHLPTSELFVIVGLLNHCNNHPDSMHMIHVQGDVLNDLVSLVHCPVLRNRNKHDNYRYVVNRADRIDATQQTRDVLT